MPLSKLIQRLTLKVLTINAHKGFTIFNRRFILRELRDAVRQAAPDIVCLQEILGEEQRRTARIKESPVLSQYEFLADTLWPEFAYGRNAVYPRGHHGNAVLSKYPISTYKNYDVSISPHEGRGLLHCILNPVDMGLNVHVICVHLGLRESHRRHQLRRLCDLVSSTLPNDEPLIIAGDFNDWRQRAEGLLQRCGVTEVFASSLGRPVRTFPARCPLLRLDRIYVRNVKASRPIMMAARPWSRLSDHIALSAEIQL
ncbi:MAG TPA: endonuclease/exonuclease/phosphatase family protein [Paralcaligenes sp.]|jgi:endonuclease/exonuclease/phosphatase family metal-dependent hydrolase